MRSSQFSYISIHARYNIGHSLTNGDQHSQELLSSIAACYKLLSAALEGSGQATKLQGRLTEDPDLT